MTAPIGPVHHPVLVAARRMATGLDRDELVEHIRLLSREWETQRWRDILTVLEDQTATTSELSAVISCSCRTTTHRLLDAMKAAAFLRVVTPGGPGAAAVWGATPNGLAWLRASTGDT